MPDHWGYTLSAYLLTFGGLFCYWLSIRRRITKREQELSSLSKGRKER